MNDEYCTDVSEIADYLPALNSPLAEKDARALSPLVLAFIGDAVQTLYSRTKFVNSGDFKAGALHKMVSSEVKAVSQSKAAKALIPDFTEEENDIFRRARNSKVHTVAKNASIADYKTASGLEAVVGYLYLTGQHQRLLYLLQKGAESI